MAPSEPQYHEILLRLADAGVEVIVVGMVAGVIQGVPATTWDLDVVHRRTPENVTRLLAVLNDIDAVARGDSRRLRPTESHLIGPGHVLLQTRFGDFDCLGTIDGGRSHDELVAGTIEIDLDGRVFRVLSLAELAAIKRRTGRPKDMLAVPLIEAALDEVRKRGSRE